MTGKHAVDILAQQDSYIFDCSIEEFENIWVSYFDLNTDYSEFQDKVSDDSFLVGAMQYGGGIRILRQDLWEMIVSYIISQRNNIPRIQKSVEMLSKNFGNYIKTIDGNEIYSFPTIEQLKGGNLSVASLGYRETYIRALCENDDFNMDILHGLNDEDVKNTLLQIKGVGEKVANCIMLFGLHRMNSYPRDVWVNRLIDDVYDGEFNADKYIGFAGYVQQLQFYYYRKMKERE